MKVINEPHLARPGAGLPFLEWVVAKYLILPSKLKKSNKESSIERFSKESTLIVELVSSLTLDDLSNRKLIKRLPGIEDSSRFWSVAMTLQHLIIVGRSIKDLIMDLSKGGTQKPKAKVEYFKPTPEIDGQTIINEFQQMSKDFVANIELADINAFPQAIFDHPWFGPLNANGWLIIAGLHQRIHRHQIEKIILQINH